MASLTRSEAAAYLLQRDHYAILTHRRPDGDTIGSAAFLCLGLRQLGKTAWILENPEITEKYVHLHKGLTKPDYEEGDTLISVDVAAPELLPECFAKLLPLIDLRIDHHGTGMPFAPYELVEPSAAACGEILHDVMQQLRVQMDVPMANALYTAVSTDTGCFRYANTTHHTLHVAAACAAVSPELFEINQALFETNSLGRLRLQGWIVENARFFAGGRIVICAIPKKVEEELCLSEDDLENVSGFPRSIAGVEIAATLRESEDGSIKVSVRALPKYDAAGICGKYGGGGHRGAGGVTLNMPLEEAAQAMIDAMPEMDDAL